MPSPIESLRRLHDLDEEVRSRKEAAGAIRRGILEREAAVAAEEEGLASDQAGAKEAVSQEKLKEVELKGLEGQIEGWTVKLNTTRDNKEYQAILHQIATLKTQKGAMEEEVLGMMDGTAGMKARVTEEERKAAEDRRAFEAWRTLQEADLQRLEGEMAERLSRRKDVSSGVPEDFLGRYERLRGSRGTALAAAQDEVCQGCFLGLTPNQINQLALLAEGGPLVTCQSCGRILYPA